MKITNLYMKKLYILVLISALPVWGIAQSEQNDSNKISSWETTKIGYELSYSKDVTGFSTILKDQTFLKTRLPSMYLRLCMVRSLV